MKQRQEVPRKFAITILLIMAVCILLILFQPIQANAQAWCKAPRPPKKNEYLQKYHKLQKSMSWDNRHKRTLDLLKEQKKQAKRDAKLARKEENILNQIAKYEVSGNN